MRVILLQDVKNIGKKYEVREVADGFARNMLIPRRLAEPATPAAIKRLEAKRAREEAEARMREELLQKTIADMAQRPLVITRRATPEGHLFAKIDADDIARALAHSAHIEVPADAIAIEEPIRAIGEYRVPITIGSVRGELHVQVAAEK